MAKDERLYARFDIAMDEHPKVMLLSDSAFRTLFEVTFYSRRQLTDGFLANGVVRRKWAAEAIAELTSNDPEKPSLYPFEKAGVAGYMIHDYDKHQTTTADIEAKRDAGRKGGLAKAKHNASKPVAPASDVPLAKGKQTSSAPLAITETETETETSKSISSPAAMVLSFDAAWKHWPKKVERKKAYEQFTKAARRLTPEALEAHIIRFGNAYAATTDRQFVPALGVWLSRERWTDELPQGTTQQKRAGGSDWALRM